MTHAVTLTRAIAPIGLWYHRWLYAHDVRHALGQRIRHDAGLMALSGVIITRFGRAPSTADVAITRLASQAMTASPAIMLRNGGTVSEQIERANSCACRPRQLFTNLSRCRCLPSRRLR